MEGSTSPLERSSSSDHIFYEIIQSHATEEIKPIGIDTSVVVDNLKLTLNELETQHPKPIIVIEKQDLPKIRTSLVAIRGPQGEAILLIELKDLNSVEN